MKKGGGQPPFDALARTLGQFGLRNKFRGFANTDY
jgi:hypothetical protein